MKIADGYFFTLGDLIIWVYYLNMQFIDSHSHIDFSEFDSDRAAVIQRAINVGVSDIIVSSTIAKRWGLVKQVCAENAHICHPAYGLHPMFINQHQMEGNDNNLEQLKLWLENSQAIAVGEIGLDFFIQGADQANRKAQLSLFISQLEIADELNLPVIIHARKSLDIILKYLRKFPKVRGAIHSFSGSAQQAKQCIDLGFYLGFGGPITYSRATRLQQLVRTLPLDVLLVESDAPDQADSSHYLQRNEPAFIPHIIEKMAILKQLEVDVVAQETTKNAIQVFQLTKKEA